MIPYLVRRSALGRSLLEVVARARLARQGSEARVHLGCGEQILPGYVNIDFPPAAHTIQRRSGADFYADIRYLQFRPGTLAEVRSHHLFEHFDRPTALALLVRWQRWLRPGGRLIVETPDFDGSASVILDPAVPFTAKAVHLRHLFGSHEASWAYHLDGWNETRFRHTLGRLGYEGIEVEHHTYLAIHNLTVRARRGALPSPEAQRLAVEELLAEALVDRSDSERALLQEWLRASDRLLRP